ncbi:MAG: AAA family ATPase [Candidatus Nealsonbacteria bacterium]|nr:AAA family ATPase [Candidatus Nealsonbacteria bacterium]
MSEPVTPFVRRVKLYNYKSIRRCDVTLGPLTLLVGPNGSGKSNFWDALWFVAEALRTPIAEVFEKRGGPMHVFSRFGADPARLEIELQLELPGSKTASFKLVVRPDPPYDFVVEEEDCAIHSEGGVTTTYTVREGKMVSGSLDVHPPASSDRLYLTVASGFPEFRELYEHLVGMLFYRIDPEAMRKHPFVGGTLLNTNGAGPGSVLQRISEGCPELEERIGEYARAILPALDRISVVSLAELAVNGGAPSASVARRRRQMKELVLRFAVHVGDESVHFSAQNMSDGTLHALGVLLALFQCANRPPSRTISLVGIEEPEATLHPAAAGVLFDALSEASHFVQVVATTHSAELLDIKDVDPESLLIVDMVNGETTIGPADEVTKSIMRDRLATAGELLRDRQLRSETQTSGPVGVETDDG